MLVLAEGLQQPSAALSNLSGRQYDCSGDILLVNQLYLYALVSQVGGCQPIAILVMKSRQRRIRPGL